MKMNSLSERLQYAMTMRGYTQGGLAKAAGVAQPTIYRLVSGEAKASRKLVDIANALKVNPDWLANGVGEMEGASTTSIARVTDTSKHIPVWNADGETDDFVIAPFGDKNPNWIAYLLDKNSGISEASAGSIVIVDTSISPGNGDLVVAVKPGSVSVYRFLDGGADGALSVDDPRVPIIDLSKPSPITLSGVVVFLLQDLRR